MYMHLCVQGLADDEYLLSAACEEQLALMDETQVTYAMEVCVYV